MDWENISIDFTEDECGILASALRHFQQYNQYIDEETWEKAEKLLERICESV